MATFPLTTLAATIDASGISAPPYADILASLQASYRLIYGQDAYLEADSQDGQLLALFALSLHDSNQAAIAVFNSFSPQTALGVGLSNVVKINHMQRLAATNSQVNVTISGIAGTTIAFGKVGDSDGNRWSLPDSVVIPSGGSIVCTATAEQPGAINATVGSVTDILTPTAGWQTVTNASAAAPGTAVETDGRLRSRQQITPAINAITVLEGLLASLRALSGVTYAKVYENDTGSTDANGIPAHTISCVVAGGDATEIATTIYRKKTEGVGTYGTTTVAITDISSTARNINFYVPTNKPIKVAISLNAYAGYTSAIADSIKAAVAANINALDFGEDLIVNRLYAPALLDDAGPESKTYKLTVLQAGLVSGSVGTSDVVIAFNERATCDVANIVITVV